MSALFIQCFLLFLGLSIVIADITFHVLEEEPLHTFIGSVANSKEHDKSSRYLFIEGKDKLFSINKKSGMIYNAIVINREELCEAENSCVFQMKVRIDSTTTKIETVNIHIDDINDNAPFFDKKVVSLEIMENNPLDKVYHIVEAWDFDSGINSLIHYSLLHNESGTFSLVENQGKLIGLKVNKVLDYEMQAFYQPVIVACDQGIPPKEAHKILNISVIDVNDNVPIFEKDVYNVTIFEDVPKFSIILRLHATDKDSGINGEVRYRLSHKTSPRIREIFEVEESSGTVNLKGSTGDKLQYSFNVIAYDQESRHLSASVPVNINVVDVNDNFPIITFEPTRVNISESKSPKAHVALININDKDENDNGKVNCSISGINQFFSLKQLSPKLLEIFLMDLLDFESMTVHNITVECEDNGKPRLKSENTLVVNVVDENDNPPVFESVIKNVNITENNKVPLSITQMIATDEDEGINSEIYYYLESDITEDFAINNRTGMITTNKIFDRESISEVYIRVLAVDCGNVPLTGIATVQLAILDVNDNKPIFQRQSYEFHVLEAEDVGTTIGCIAAMDLDVHENGAISYVITSNNKASQYFMITDGILKNKDILNHKINPRYDFIVSATDHGQNPLSSSANVTIIVDDANDNSPYIIYPSNTNNSISISYESTPADQPIAQVIAYDDDEEENSRLSYFLKNTEQTTNVFRINQTSGEIMLVKGRNIDTLRKKYALSIYVKDHGRPPKVNHAMLYVYLEEGTPLMNTHKVIPIILSSCVALIFVVIIASACFMIKANKQKRHYFAKKYEDASLRRRHHDASKENEFNNNSGKSGSLNRSISERNHTQFLQENVNSPDTDDGPSSEVNTPITEQEAKANKEPSFQYSNLLCKDEANNPPTEEIVEYEIKDETEVNSPMDRASIKGSRAALLDD